MSVLKFLNHTNSLFQVVATGSNRSGQTFVERAHLTGTGISLLTIYDGGDINGKVVGVLQCAANTSDDLLIQELCPNGVYVTMTTGAGIAKAVIFDR